ncbi:c-type cytochrome [Magnetospirillum sulfuroxidans]|uniref:C-type cytochrome n=1 Tax=Magnetospirillum sulfuroxidans TaxID=611300 RepID=A0ABS5I896_9PROT|nr:c-type cytochrome [Magnetospirillum sulfuroxidans]MBR9970644.1 c-type cytochrome [Magnetospirillum sulfuroxidans]
MRWGSVVVIVGLAGAIIGVGAWWWQGQGRIDPDNPTQVARGKAVYDRHCGQCHGLRLQGEPNWRTRLPSGELPAPPHDASGHTWHHADEYLFAVTKHGLARFAPPDYKTNMPSFVGKLSDDDIRASLAYIKSLWPVEIRQRQEGLNRR